MSMFSPRIRLKALVQMCHRLALSTKAGIHDRKIWRSEAERGSRTQQRVVGKIRDEINAGQSVGQAVRGTGEYFPLLFRQMVAVGEKSGQLMLTYQRLATHYERTLRVQREFLSRLAWPMMQLGLALAVIGLLIWIMGMLSGPGEKKVDLIGFGLVGTEGLMIYLNVLILAVLFLFLMVEMARRGFGWTRSLQRQAVRTPFLGIALKTLALARFTWALQLVLQTAMDLRQAIPLALQATGNDYFARWGADVALRIEQGQTMHEALASTGVFPSDLLDNIAVGEETGSLVEVMERQSAEYQRRAGTAMSVLAQTAGYAIWLLIAGLIIAMIFRLFSSYVGMLNDAAMPI
ncbi:MAG: type II secretion system F family protein [Pirellulales bacterium]|nr:type II secretion system F family protein [Pirellulales bacterium]